MSTDAAVDRKRINVLIFPAGAENALEIYRAIRNSIHVNALAASSRDDISSLIYDQPILPLPEMEAPDFLEQLDELIRRNDIDVVFPTHDSAALFLAEHADEIPASVPNADLRTNLICRYKARTYELFRDDPFCPEVHHAGEQAPVFPLFAKPDVGQGSKGTRVVRDRHDLDEVRKEPGMLVLEYLPGKEYTVECFTDRRGRLVFTGTRERVEIRMGISFRSRETATTTEIQAIADRINERMALRGLWWFQIKEAADGKMKLLEVSTRAPGTGGFFRHLGVNLPLLTIFDLLDRPVEIRPAPFQVEMFRSTTNHYRYSFTYDHVYVDLDDTLIVRGAVNADLVRFLYLAAARGKRLVLITKSVVDPRGVLRDHHLDPALFDEIVHLDADEKKSNYITEVDSIFIDNWYLERREVAEATGIPTFDVDAVEGLVHSL
ncbi:ATP-grasp domain-containing protein [Microbacterium sp. KUDC0406]|uniref:ATP-grasp domain-containing protein n=1 Tax=Microbacterium sp. KUDC0406 TaxID=2909588 RepID=UPI001F370EC1|nr:ATP-grasp domain-containing protein [Microbacterium sp. KUDC0406]UJP08917.1 ATP-grasp domain-containing protein [Microbacterium sp. KUDC0406]